MFFGLSKRRNFLKERRGFTLIELLITVAVIAVLMTVTVVTLNPAEYLRKSRDVKRISDLTNLQIALQLVAADPSVSLGVCDGTKIYASVPSETPLSNDNLPSGVSWVQVSQSNLMKTDGTGWIPVDLKTFSSKGLVLPALPIDPKNSASDYLFYTYTCNSNRQFVLTAWFESQAFGPKGQDPKSKNDAGPDPYLYEVGSNLFIHPLRPAAYWSFDEGNGNIAYDRSGNENNGTLYNGPTWVDGKVGKALSFDGIDDYVYIPDSNSLKITGPLTISFLAYPTNISKGRQNPFGKAYGGEYDLTMETTTALSFYQGSAGNNNTPYVGCYSISMFNNNSWTFVDLTRNITTKTIAYYKNGQINPSSCGTWVDPSVSTRRVGIGYEYAGYWQGIIDEVLLYPRTLSAAEINRHYQLIK
ncbi:MAG: LamG-like jellyroll fold domain-containing protein [Minisyncoccia bacterium]